MIYGRSNKNWAANMKTQTDKQGQEQQGLSEMEIVLQNEELHKNLKDSHLQDSGQRELYITGAQRDNGQNKGRFDLIAPQALLRLARHYEYGSKKYADRNWEQGMPIGRMVDAAMRHLVKYLAGANDEDHLAAVLWNVAAIMHYEAYMPELQNLPTRQGLPNRFIYPIDREDE